MSLTRNQRWQCMLAFAICLGVIARIAQADGGAGPLILGQSSQLGRLDIRGEYLFWWSEGNALPPLVTTSPVGTPRTDAGTLGSPGVETLFGGDQIDDRLRPGGRLSLTQWFYNDESVGLEGTVFYVGDDEQSGDFFATSSGSPILARPFFNLQTGVEGAELVAFPNVLAGGVDVNSASEIYSASVLLNEHAMNSPLGRVYLLGGYRFFRLRERLSIREQLTSTDPGGSVPLGTEFDLSDRFHTKNDFHGGEVGVSTELVQDIFSLELLAKVAFGNLRRQSSVTGDTSVTVPGFPATNTSGGLLALPSNIGAYVDSRFVFLPEFGINGTVFITRRWSFVFGYSLILLTDVARTGSQIDRVINTTQVGGNPLAGDPRPAFPAGRSDMWLQGMNLGFDFRW